MLKIKVSKQTNKHNVNWVLKANSQEMSLDPKLKVS